MTTASFRRQFEAHRLELPKLFDKLPPHAIEAECALLGSMILDWRVIGEVVQIIQGATDFYKPAHSAIYEALIHLYDHNQSLDMVQLKQRLADMGQLEEVGGIAYLVELAESVPSAVSAPHYARLVREKALLRYLIDAAGKILYDAYNTAEPVGNQLDQAEQAIFRLAENGSGDDASELKQLLQETYERLEAHDGRAITGVETGFFELDEMTNGLQNGEMIIIAARPSMGKCLAADARITLADGRVRTIEQICQAQEAELFTLGDDLRLKPARPSAFIDDGVKPVFRVTTRLGRSVTTTLTHPFLTIAGWKKLGELAVGDHVAVPRRMPAFGTRSLGEARVKLLGYLLGDGGLTGSCPRFTSGSATLRGDFRAAVAALGDLEVSEEDSGGTRTTTLSVVSDRQQIAARRAAFGVQLRAALLRCGRTARQVATELQVSPASLTHWCAGTTAPDAATWQRLCAVLALAAPAQDDTPAAPQAMRKNAPNALTRWLTELGVWGCGAKEKFIPDAVFTLPREELALFVNRLFATDGWACVLASGQAQLGFASVSRRMAQQLQHLLLRFGVIAALRRRGVKYGGALRPAFQLDITDAQSIRTFAVEIGIFGKEAALARVAEALEDRHYQTNRDLIPKGVWPRIDAARGELSWRQVGLRMGLAEDNNLHVGRRALSRDRLWRFGEALDDPRLRDLASSDVYWDQIVSIEHLGDQQVYDLTIPETHNFIADDVCVHNTAFALNIAEHVAATNRQPVAVFSLEMGKQQLAQRLLCSRSAVDSHKLRRNMLSADDFHELAKAVGELSEAPLYIDDTPGLTLLALRAKARRLAARHHIKMVMVDYMQLMSSPGAESRQQEVSSISRGIKGLARELNVPVICLSQLNRSSEGREGHRPRMSDLRESGSIEQDADVVMMLHREDYYHRGEEGYSETNTAEVIVCKQRNGPTGTVQLQFNGGTTRFHNLATSRPPGGY